MDFNHRCRFLQLQPFVFKTHNHRLNLWAVFYFSEWTPAISDVTVLIARLAKIWTRCGGFERNHRWPGIVDFLGEKKQTKSESPAKKLVQYCLIWVILPTKKKICMSHSRTKVSTEINANSCGVLYRIYFFGVRPIWQRTNSSPCRRTRESNKKQFQHSETRLWTSFRVSRSSKTSLQHRSFFFNMPCVWFCKEDFYEEKSEIMKREKRNKNYFLLIHDHETVDREQTKEREEEVKVRIEAETSHSTLCPSSAD